jgi:hypothetical protein
MTVSELIEELRAMPSEATVMLWSRMDDPQHRRVQRVELSTTKSDPTAEIVVLSESLPGSTRPFKARLDSSTNVADLSGCCCCVPSISSKN